MAGQQIMLPYSTVNQTRYKISTRVASVIVFRCTKNCALDIKIKLNMKIIWHPVNYIHHCSFGLDVLMCKDTLQAETSNVRLDEV